MFNFYIPTRLIFGAGALNKLNKWATLGKKALITVSNGKSTKANGYLDRTVAELEKAGGISYITDLAKITPSAANYKYYLDIVKRDSIHRRLIRASQKIIDEPRRAQARRWTNTALSPIPKRMRR